MLRSVLHRQRFHTQDEREMNTEDAGGDMGALTTPAIATLTASLHQAELWEDPRRRHWDWSLPPVQQQWLKSPTWQTELWCCSTRNRSWSSGWDRFFHWHFTNPANPDRLGVFHQWAWFILKVSWCSASHCQPACPATTPPLLLHFSEAIIEWALRQG